MPYKTKGIYVSKRKNGYALYRGHSERVPGKKNPVFKCDEYLGIVTEVDGLIPPSPPVRPDIAVYRYGLFCVAERFCQNLRKAPERNGVDPWPIYARCLLALEGRCDAAGYEGSWLCVSHPGLAIERKLGSRQEEYLSRMRVQMSSCLGSGLGEDKDRVLSLASNVSAVHVNGRWLVSRVGEDPEGVCAKYGISFELEMT